MQESKEQKLIDKIHRLMNMKVCYGFKENTILLSKKALVSFNI